jgi:2-oxoisovalerate dehydrogenase E1 component
VAGNAEKEFLGQMLLCREGDRREGILLRQGRGWINFPALGHETLMVLAGSLSATDLLFPYFRDRPLMLSRGMSHLQLARDFFATSSSSSAGRNWNLQNGNRASGLFSVATPTGAQCLPAVGAAWGIKLRGEQRLVLCTIGDAATREGEFYEAVCFAVQLALPIVFLVEDNGYGISTLTRDMLPLRFPVFDSSIVTRVDGRDAQELSRAGAEIFSSVRGGAGPRILWVELDRIGSHSNADDHRVYRTPEDLDQMVKQDPVERLARRLVEAGEMTREELEAMRQEAAKRIADVYQQAAGEPGPDPSRVMEQLYAPEAPPPQPPPLRPDGEPATLAGSINRVLRASLEQDPRVLLFGQDVEDPKGGVFKLTRGLSSQFPGRVVNAPLAEATIVGAAIGLASAGFKPVIEIQFVDFLNVAFNQLASQVSTLRWRTNGDWTCPMVIYAPYGAYTRGGGLWHSQSNEGWWAHLPGIRVAVPSTPEDAAGLFWAAIQGDDPSLILVPKRLLFERREAPEYAAVPFGRAAIRRTGTDVTVVAWGNCVQLACSAADQLAGEGRSVEVIDLRSLVPCDWATVEDSLRKTGRLVVVQEDSVTCSFGQAVISAMTTEPHRFDLFLAQPRLVSRPDVHIPVHPDLAAAVLPDVERVVEAILSTLR